MPTIKVKDTKYPNKCNTCGKTIPAHSISFWDKENGKNYHEGCEPANSRTQAHPEMNPRSSAKATDLPKSPFTADEADLAQKIAIRLKKAREIVRKEYALPEGVEDYQLSRQITECLHQLGSESLSVKIQANKESNMAKVGR